MCYHVHNLGMDVMGRQIFSRSPCSMVTAIVCKTDSPPQGLLDPSDFMSPYTTVSGILVPLGSMAPFGPETNALSTWTTYRRPVMQNTKIKWETHLGQFFFVLADS